MKKLYSLILVILLLLPCESAFAAKARSISSEADSIYHAEHLTKHLGETGCYATGNYIKARSKANGSKIVGHIEQADEFILLDVKNDWAQIEVTKAAKTSPDSWKGMVGWVNSDYVDCNCSIDTYSTNSMPKSVEYYCKTNNLRVRNKPVNGAVIGHIEKADQFNVLEILDGWAKITVTYSANTSPDSWIGLSGWVSVDYIEPKSTTTNSSSWKTAYHDYLISNSILLNLDSSAEYWFVFIDNDSVPELIINTNIVAGGCHVLTYCNGKVDAILIGSTGIPAYIEKGNLLLDSAGHQGCYYDTIYTITNGKWKQIYHSENYELPSPNYEIDQELIHTYYIDGQKVTRSKYNSTLSIHFDQSKATKLISGKSIMYLSEALQ